MSCDGTQNHVLDDLNNVRKCFCMIAIARIQSHAIIYAEYSHNELAYFFGFECFFSAKMERLSGLFWYRTTLKWLGALFFQCNNEVINIVYHAKKILRNVVCDFRAYYLYSTKENSFAIPEKTSF